VTLRTKTLVIVGSTLVGLIFVLYFTLSAIALSSFAQLEEDDVERNLQRVREALSNQMAQMDVTARDWALPGTVLDKVARDLDTYGRATTPDGKNALADLVANLNANVFLFTDASGNLVWGQGYDDKTEELVPVPESLQDQLVPESSLIRHPDDNSSLMGLVPLSEGPMMVVSEYVLSTKDDEPIRGTVLLGSYLDDAMSSNWRS
jgi:sensor domain CHASE-containing protein